MSESRFRRALESPVIWPFAGIVLLLVVNLIVRPSFLSLTVLDGHLYGLPIDVLKHGATTLVLALGMTLVIATGGIDLSVGSVVAIAGAVAAMLFGHGVASLPLIVGGALAAGAAAGLVNGVLVAKLGVQPIVATLILMVAGRGIDRGADAEGLCHHQAQRPARLSEGSPRFPAEGRRPRRLRRLASLHHLRPLAADLPGR